MYKIINGKRYSTDTATRVARWNNGIFGDRFDSMSEDLYVKKNGEFFLHGYGGAHSKYGVWFGESGGPGEQITPVSASSAMKWAENHLEGDVYENIFGVVDPEEEETPMNKRLTFLLPEGIYDALQKKKSETGIALATLIVKALKDAGY